MLKLSKQPGEREHRWAHLLCGEAVIAAADTTTKRGAGDGSAFEVRIAQLEQEVADLRAEVARLAARIAG